MEKTNQAINSSLNDKMFSRAKNTGLWGLVANWDKVARQPWLPDIIEYEETERAHRSLQRRLLNAKLGQFRAIADFDWKWPNEIDRETIEELLQLNFVTEPANVIIVGKNGVGKTMIAKNIAHHAILNGYSARFISASQLLNDLAAQETSSALTRRLRLYCHPQILVIDELGYLATSNEHADLLFELVTRRYQVNPIILTTNKAFTDWNEVFPNSACVVTLIDRLVHKAEIIKIDAESYRLKEAKERAETKIKSRSKKTKGENKK